MEDIKAGFSVVGGKGFQITFPNGYCVSVQFGNMHYCANRGGKDGGDSISAEVAVFGPDGNFINMGGHDDVIGHQSPLEVLEILNKYSKK